MEHAVSIEFIEIPEPDYDLDDNDEGVGDDDVIGSRDAAAAAPAAAVAPASDEESGTDDAGDDDIAATTISSAETAPEDEGFEACNFEQFRAKLDAFSREKQTVAAALWSGWDVPDPDYNCDDSDIESNPTSLKSSQKADIAAAINHSKEQRELLRELLRNQKLGVSVLSKKTELDKEMEKRKVRQRQREEEELLRLKRSTFDLKMEKQARKLAEQQQEPVLREAPAALTSSISSISDDQQPEFLRVHSKISKLKSAAS